MLTEEQLEERKNGIGGSDAGVVLGLSRFKTPLSLYLEKIGEIEPEDLSDNDAVHFGCVLEDVVADEYSRRTGRKVRRANQTLLHPDHEWMMAHIDRGVVSPGNRILECKTAGTFMASEWGEPGTDDIPEYYLAQCHHYLGVTGADIIDVAVLIGGQDFRIYEVQRDQVLIDALIQVERSFWYDNVLANEPPPPSTSSEANVRWPWDTGATVIAEDAIVGAMTELKELKAKIKELDQEQGTLELLIKKFMGDAAILDMTDDCTLATWKNQITNRLDTKALKAAQPDIYKQFTKTTEGRRFLVK